MMYLSDELYRTIADSTPIPCVDIIPVKNIGGVPHIGIIIRGTGSQVGKAAVMGGRVQHNESMLNAINRHMETDWKISNYTFLPGNSISRPFYVQQYLHQDASVAPFGFDPSKHAIALTYLIELDAEPIATNEAREFIWIDEDHIPHATGYNQQYVMKEAFDFLKIKNLTSL